MKVAEDLEVVSEADSEVDLGEVIVNINSIIMIIEKAVKREIREVLLSEVDLEEDLEEILEEVP